MATEPARGRPSKEKKQRNGPLSLALYQHFVDYLCGEFLPSPEDLLRAGFKSEANHPFKMQEKFMFWATKMTYDEESGYVVHKQSQRFIIPWEKFDEAIKQAHVTDFGELLGENEEGATPRIGLGLDGRKTKVKKRSAHNGLNETLRNLQSVYTFGRRSFGMTTDIVKSVLLKCDKKKCCLFNRIWGPRKKADGSKLPEEDKLEEEMDDYDGRQEISPDGDTLDTAEEVDPYDLVFGCPTELPDFGCSDAYNTGAASNDDVFADNPQDKSSMECSNSSSSNGAHPIDYSKKSLSSSNIAADRFHADGTGIKRAVEHPEIVQHPDICRPPSSAAGAPPDDEDKAELSADSDCFEVSKTIDGIQRTRTVLDGVTFYEYVYPSEDTGEKTMGEDSEISKSSLALAKRKRRKGSDIEDGDYAPKQWKRWQQVDHMPMTRRSSSSDGEKKADATMPNSKLTEHLDYLTGVSDISSDEEVKENVGLYRVRRNKDGTAWDFNGDLIDPIMSAEYVKEQECVRSKPTFGLDGQAQVDRFETILGINPGPTENKENTSQSRTSAEVGKTEDREKRLQNQRLWTSTANLKHGKMASVDREDAETDQRKTKPKVTDSPINAHGRHMLPSFMESLGLQACPRLQASISSRDLVSAETGDVSDENEEGPTSSRMTETNPSSIQIQSAVPDQTSEDSLDTSFDDPVSEGVDVAGYVNYGSSQADENSNASSSQVSDADCNNDRLDITEDKVISSKSDFLDGKEAILPNGRKVRVYCRNTEYSEPRGPKPSESQEVDANVVRESERDDRREVQGKQRCTSPLIGSNRNIDPSSQEYRAEVPIGVIHPIQHNLTGDGDEIVGRPAHENAPADLEIYPEVTDPVHQDDMEDTANRSCAKGDAIEMPLSPVLKKLDPDVALPGTPNNSEKSDFEDHLDKSPSTEGPSVYAVEMIQNKEKMFVPLEGVEDGLKTPGSKTPWGHFQLKEGCLLPRDATPPSRITRSQMAVTSTKISSAIEPYPQTPKTPPFLSSMGGNISVSQSPPVKSPAMKTQISESDSDSKKTIKILSGSDGNYYCFEPKTESYRSILPNTKQDPMNRSLQPKKTRPKSILPKTEWDPNNPNQKIDIEVERDVHQKVSSKERTRNLPLKVKIITQRTGSDKSKSTIGETPVSQAASVPATVKKVFVVRSSDRQVLPQLGQNGEQSVLKKRKGSIKEENISLNKGLDNASKGIGIRFVTTNSTKSPGVNCKRTVRQLLGLQNKDIKENEDSVPMKLTMNLTIKELMNLAEQVKEPLGIQGDRDSENASDVDHGQPGTGEQTTGDLDEAADSFQNHGEILEQFVAGMDVNNNSCGDECKVSNAKKDTGQRFDQSLGLTLPGLHSMPQVTLVDVTEECKKKSRQGDQVSSSVLELTGQELASTPTKKRKHTNLPTVNSLRRKKEQIATIQQLRKQAGRYDYKKELESVREDMTEEKFRRLRELVEIRLESQEAKVRVTQIMKQRIELMKQWELDRVGSVVREEQKVDNSSRDAGEPSTKVSSSREKLKAAINLVNRCHGKVTKLQDADSGTNTTKPTAPTNTTKLRAKTVREKPEALQRGRVQVTAADERSTTATTQNAAIAGQKAETDGRMAEKAGQIAEAAGRKAEADGQRAETDGRMAGKAGQIAEAAGRKAEADGQRAETDGRMAGKAGQIAEAAGQMAEVAGQKAEVEEQMAEADGWKAANAAPQNVREALRNAQAAIRNKETAAEAASDTGRIPQNTAAEGRNKAESRGQASEPRQSPAYSRPEVTYARRIELPDHGQTSGPTRNHRLNIADQRQKANDQVQKMAEERRTAANREADQRRMANDQIQRLAHERQMATDRIDDQRQIAAAQRHVAADQRQMAAERIDDQRQMAVDQRHIAAGQRQMTAERIDDQRQMAVDQRQMEVNQRQRAVNQRQIAADMMADQGEMAEVQRQGLYDQREFMTSVSGKVTATGMKFYYRQPKSTAATSTMATHAISSPFESPEYIPAVKKRMGHRRVKGSVMDPLEKQNINLNSVSHGDPGQTQCHGLGKQTTAAPAAVDTIATLGEAGKRQQPMEINTGMATKHRVDSDVLDGEAKRHRRSRKRIKRTESGDVELSRSGEGGALELIRAGDGTKRKNPIPISSMPLPTAAHFAKVANIKCPPYSQPRSCEAHQMGLHQSNSSTYLSSLSPPASNACCPMPTSSATCGVYTHPGTTYAYSHAPAYTTEPHVSNYVTPQKQHQRGHGQWISEATPPAPGRISTPDSSQRYQMMPVQPECAQRSSHCLFPTNPFSFVAADYLPGVVGVPAAKADVKKGPRVVDEYEILTNTIRDMRNFIRPAQAGRRYSMNILGNMLIPTATDQVQRFRRLLDEERMKDVKQ